MRRGYQEGFYARRGTGLAIAATHLVAYTETLSIGHSERQLGSATPPPYHEYKHVVTTVSVQSVY